MIYLGGLLYGTILSLIFILFLLINLIDVSVTNSIIRENFRESHSKTRLKLEINTLIFALLYVSVTWFFLSNYIRFFLDFIDVH